MLTPFAFVRTPCDEIRKAEDKRSTPTPFKTLGQSSSRSQVLPSLRRLGSGLRGGLLPRQLADRTVTF